jgi:hypothetical protein
MMARSEADKKSFEEAARPLIKWLAENANPHHTALVTNMKAELLSGEIVIRDESFLRD